MNAHITGTDLKTGSEGISVELGGKSYCLTMDMNALCDIEDRYGDIKNLPDVISAGKMKDLRFILAAMLRHTDDSITESTAGKLITVQNVQELTDKMGKAMEGSMPEPKKE